MQSSCSSNCSAAVLLAAVTSDLLPDAVFVAAGATQRYFFCDFSVPSTAFDQLLPFIEERMRLVFREGRSVRTLEMVPSNAMGLLRSRGLVALAEQVGSSEEKLIELIQLGDFAAPFPFALPAVFSASHFRLIEAFSIGSSQVRVVGVAGDKQEVKALLKQPLPSSFAHRCLIETQELFTYLPPEEAWVWRPKGEKLRAEWIEWWKQTCAQHAVSVIATPAPFLHKGDEAALTACHLHYMQATGEHRTAELAQVAIDEVVEEGLLSPRVAWVDRVYILTPCEKLVDELISSLQFILQIPKILGFEYEVIVSLSGGGSKKRREVSLAAVRKALQVLRIQATEEKRKDLTGVISVELSVLDALGRGWTGPFLKVICSGSALKEERVIVRSVFGSLERFVALLLERRERGLSLDKVCAGLRTVCYNETGGITSESTY